MHVSLAFKKHGHGVMRLDNFNPYYDPSLEHARRDLLAQHGIYVEEGDVGDAALLAKLFDIVAFMHVMHLDAQAGVRYVIENPGSYACSNVAVLVMLLETCKEADPQSVFMWASSSSVYRLKKKVPFSESDHTAGP